MKQFKCHCPEGVSFGDYTQSVQVIIPDFIQLRKNDLEGTIRTEVCIDVCLMSEVFNLWREGIITTGCCCGHNKDASAYIGVKDEFIQQMKDMGYQVHPNPCRPGDEDFFYPKTLTEMCEQHNL